MTILKYTIPAACAIVAFMLSACDKYSCEETPDIGKEIVFSTSGTAGSGTRSVAETTLSELADNGFRVLAKVNSDGLELFNSKVVKQQEVWKVPDKKYYFPTGTTMDFYAAYPDSEVLELSGGDAVLNYTLDTDKDLVVAKAVDVSSSRSAVELNFKHVLSQIQFRFKGGAAGVDYILNNVCITAPSRARYTFSDEKWTIAKSETVYSVLDSHVSLSSSSADTVGETMTFVPGKIIVTANWTCSQEGRSISQLEASFDLEMVEGQKMLVSCTLPDSDADVIAFKIKTDPWEESSQEIIITKVPEPLKFETDSENRLFLRDLYGMLAPENMDICLEYSYDKQHWYEWADPLDSNNGLEIGTEEHPFVYIRGENPDGIGYYQEDYQMAVGPGFACESDGRVRCSGNIMSLINYKIATDQIPGPGSFAYLFSQMEQLVSAPELPATTLACWCYINMFSGCTSLENAPELPAMTMEDWCYFNMFHGCTALENAPELPATTLADNCYYMMFYDCTSLVGTPEKLPAMTLEDWCYSYMFYGCTSLVSAPELPAVNLADACYNCMFCGCASLVTAPELPAPILKETCYSNMFNQCISLDYIKCLAIDLSAPECLYNWTHYTPNKGTFVKTPGVDWPSGPSGIPTGWLNGKLPVPEPLKFEAGSRVTFSLDCGYATCYCDICEMCNENSYFEFSYDNRNWAQFEIDDVLEFGIPQHPCLYLRGNNPDGFGYWCQDCDCYEGPTFIFNGDEDVKVRCSGNIMSLINSEESITVIPEKGCFACLFMDTPILSAPDLPATTLKEDCYNMMFSGCESLVIAPEFPVSIMDQDWAREYYDQMF